MKKQQICLLLIVLVTITQITIPGLGHVAIEENHYHLEFDPKYEIPKTFIDQKYPDTAGTDIVTDAPWRVLGQTNGWIPLLIFVPDVYIDDYSNNNRFRGIEFERITIYDGRNPLYHDSNDESPTSGNDFVVIDENGNKVSPNIAGSDIPSGETDSGIHCDVAKTTETVGGWHRIIRIPINKLSGRKQVFLKTEIVAKPVYDNDEKVPDEYIKEKRIFFSRTLRIYVGDEPFPSLDENWHYFDAHIHTIAEWSQGRKLLSPRKAFGGPIQMIKESALAMGLISSIYKNEKEEIDDFKDQVIATDHNAFFSDDFVVSVGPSAGKPKEFTWDAERFDTEKGQSEFENLRKVFGETFGEEVTLKTDFNTDKINSGTHLILLRGEHVNGPWHGGLLYFRFLGINFGKLIGGEPNDNSLEDVLSNAASQQSVPFAFAAHPFAKGNHWNMTKKENYMELFHDRSGKYITEKGEKKFIFKGAQYWNGKRDHVLNADKIKSIKSDKEYIKRNWNVDFFDLHPFPGAPRTPLPTDGLTYLPEGSYPTFKPDSKWEIELKRGLNDWHRRIRELLRFSFEDTPNDKFPRKIYMFGGSDAHGDFNYETSLLATILDNKFFRAFKYSGRELSTNAFAKVRTYVNFNGKLGADNNEKALNALADGNSVITDGPVITFSFDSDLRFDSELLRWKGRLIQDPDDIKEEKVKKNNRDGRIGGNGNYDGGFTALVVKRAKHAAISYRWNNSGEFGRRFGGKPDNIQLYMDTPEIHEEPILSEIDDKEEVEEIKSIWRTSPNRSEKKRDTIIKLEEINNLAKITINFETILALSMGIFAEKKESNENYRCYTNPIWIIPVEVVLSKAEVENGRIAPGKLGIVFRFEMSMAENPYEVMLSLLDEEENVNGEPFSLLPDKSYGNEGWDTYTNPEGLKISHGEFHVTNEKAIELLEKEDLQRFMICLKNPQDLHNNTLNSIAAVVNLPSLKVETEIIGSLDPSNPDTKNFGRLTLMGGIKIKASALKFTNIQGY